MLQAPRTSRSESFAARMADARRRARLTPAETAALVALGEAQINGRVENARPFHKGGRTHYRVEMVLSADEVEAVLRTLAEKERSGTELAPGPSA